mmetsp:Transcript_28999/g.78480  ORF Transcript_28999/g.78480 Transcript_28999/m.78480 type:complete len:154 (+) Transcript_28999:495-956(+)
MPCEEIEGVYVSDKDCFEIWITITAPPYTGVDPLAITSLIEEEVTTGEFVEALAKTGLEGGIVALPPSEPNSPKSGAGKRTGSRKSASEHFARGSARRSATALSRRKCRRTHRRTDPGPATSTSRATTCRTILPRIAPGLPNHPRTDASKRTR